MRWRTRARGRILASLQDSIVSGLPAPRQFTQLIPADREVIDAAPITAITHTMHGVSVGYAISFAFTSYSNWRVDDGTFDSSVVDLKVPFKIWPKITLQAHATHMPLMLKPVTSSIFSCLPETTRARSIELELVPCLRDLSSALMFDGSVALSTDLRVLAAVPGRFAFNRLRSDQHLFARGAPRSKSVALVARIPKPPLPPTSSTTLEERLKWILTPPIAEVLSDPALALPHPPHRYQIEGIQWLYNSSSALLADEMGLGKTMQAIIAARLLWREERLHQVLIVCPKMLIPNWRREINAWWPDAIYNTKIIDSDPQWGLRLATKNVTIKIINYERLARELDWLQEQRFSHDLVILDEAQKIKNPTSKTSKATKALRAHRRWALTGTPLENRIEDVISLFDYLSPDLLKSDSVTHVRTAIKPFMLRRRTDEVLQDLPEKFEQDISIELTDKQREAYTEAEESGVDRLNEHGDLVTTQHVFALITKLMQLCNFEPASGSSAKLDRLREDLEEIRASGRKALVFSRFVSFEYGLQRVAKVLETTFRFEQLHGGIPARSREDAISRFTDQSDCNFILLNYAVGGLGLNLQAANYVFLFDRWWNPAVEDQAVKRAHRIGQKDKVFVRRFMCVETIEERIVLKLAEKRRLFAHVIDEDRLTPQALGLTEEELFALFPKLTARPKRIRPSKEPVAVIADNLDASGFEELVARVYEAQGYTVIRRGGPYDGGIDLLSEKVSGAGRERVVVQCKHVKDKVGPAVIRELWGVVTNDASCTRGDLVTSAGFTREALSFADGKRLTLIDCDRLTSLARELKVADIRSTQ